MRSLPVHASVAVALACGVVAAQPAATDPPPALSTARRAGAIAVAILPGVVLRGAGSLVAREPRTAKRLAVIGGVGLAGVVVGGVPVLVSGASERVIVPFVPLLVSGAGLLLASWGADLWVAAGGDRIRGVALAAVPWSIEVGATWLRDPFRERAYGRLGGRIERGRLGLGALGLVDARGAAIEGLAEARVRILGAPAHGGPITDGSTVGVRAAVRGRTDDADRLSAIVAEAEVQARLDLQRIDRALAGVFSELSTGLGVQRVAYAGGAHDLGALLIGGFAWGAYLGARGEASVFYEHRRDHLAGGLAAVRASGFLGSVGVRTSLRVLGPWAVDGQLEIGSAWVTTLALRHQGGVR